MEWQSEDPLQTLAGGFCRARDEMPLASLE